MFSKLEDSVSSDSALKAAMPHVSWLVDFRTPTGNKRRALVKAGIEAHAPDGTWKCMIDVIEQGERARILSAARKKLLALTPNWLVQRPVPGQHARALTI